MRGFLLQQDAGLLFLLLVFTSRLFSGYERYNAMRADPDLCFLERVGMPDETALSAEQGGGEGPSEVTDRYVRLI